MSAGESDWLTAMRATIAAATPGPWIHEDSTVDDLHWGPMQAQTIRPMGYYVAGTRPRFDFDHIAAWCPDNARKLLARHDRTTAAAEQMAAALAEVVGQNLLRHSASRDGTCWLTSCGLPWPCPTAQAADALRALQDRQAG